MNVKLGDLVNSENALAALRERKKKMSKKRAIQRARNNGQKNIAQPMPVIAEPPPAPPPAAFVITIAYDPQSEVVNFNTVRQGDGTVYVDDQIKALRNTYEAFVGRLAIEVNKAAEAQQQNAAKG